MWHVLIDLDIQPTTDTFRTDVYYARGAIFDVRWSQSDKAIALATARSEALVIDAEYGSTTATMYGHTRSQKVVRWNPYNENMLSTGSRDGSICIWDLRAQTRGRIRPVIRKLNPHNTHGRIGTVTDLAYGDKNVLYSSSNCDA